MLFCILIIVILIGIVIWQQLRINQGLKNAEKTKEQLNAVAADYISLHEFDLKNDVFYAIKSNAAIDGLSQKLNTNINFQIQNIMKGLATEGSRNTILEFVNMTTLMDRMEGKDIISCDFEGVKNGWCRAEFLWLDRDALRVLFGVRTIDADKTREDGLRFLAEKDFLTGVYNTEKGRSLIEGALRRNDKGMFCLFEIDNFKQVNDAMGSAKGDQIIRLMASDIQSALGSNAIVYRRGGARFSAFLKDVEDKNEARFLLNQIIDGFNNLDRSEYDIDISVSVGVAFHSKAHGITLDTLISNAETCLATSRAISGVSVSYYD